MRILNRNRNASHSNLKPLIKYSTDINMGSVCYQPTPLPTPPWQLSNSGTVNTQSLDSCRLRTNWKRLPRGHCNKQSLPSYRVYLQSDPSRLILKMRSIRSIILHILICDKGMDNKDLAKRLKFYFRQPFGKINFFKRSGLQA